MELVEIPVEVHEFCDEIVVFVLLLKLLAVSHGEFELSDDSSLLLRPDALRRLNSLIKLPIQQTGLERTM